MKRCFPVLVLAALVLITVRAAADEPPFPHVWVDPADATGGPIVAPGHPSPIPACVETITVHNANNQPVSNAVVDVVFHYSGAIHPCGDAVLTGVTNSSGVLVLNFTAGGC